MGACISADGGELPWLVEDFVVVVVVDGWQLAFVHSRCWRRRADGLWFWRKPKLKRHDEITTEKSRTTATR